MQGWKHVTDDRNYSSLADEFTIAAATQRNAADEVIDHDDNDDDDDDAAIDDDVNTVRRRVPTKLGDSV